MKLIYESKHPKFAILCDSLQWAVAFKRDPRALESPQKGGQEGWRSEWYFPNISGLLDALGEWLVRKNAKYSDSLRGIEDAVIKTYKQIESLEKHLSLPRHE